MRRQDPFIRHEDVTMPYFPSAQKPQPQPNVRPKGLDWQMLTLSEQLMVEKHLHGELDLEKLSAAAQTFVRRHCQVRES